MSSSSEEDDDLLSGILRGGEDDEPPKRRGRKRKLPLPEALPRGPDVETDQEFRERLISVTENMMYSAGDGPSPLSQNVDLAIRLAAEILRPLFRNLPRWKVRHEHTPLAIVLNRMRVRPDLISRLLQRITVAANINETANQVDDGDNQKTFAEELVDPTGLKLPFCVALTDLGMDPNGLLAMTDEISAARLERIVQRTNGMSPLAYGLFSDARKAAICNFNSKYRNEAASLCRWLGMKSPPKVVVFAATFLFKEIITQFTDHASRIAKDVWLVERMQENRPGVGGADSHHPVPISTRHYRSALVRNKRVKNGNFLFGPLVNSLNQ
ncbi:unnamed protein product, partial [Mesorhabditis spiculigera]